MTRSARAGCFPKKCTWENQGISRYKPLATIHFSFFFLAGFGCFVWTYFCELGRNNGWRTREKDGWKNSNVKGSKKRLLRPFWKWNHSMEGGVVSYLPTICDAKLASQHILPKPLEVHNGTHILTCHWWSSDSKPRVFFMILAFSHDLIPAAICWETWANLRRLLFLHYDVPTGWSKAKSLHDPTAKLPWRHGRIHVPQQF